MRMGVVVLVAGESTAGTAVVVVIVVTDRCCRVIVVVVIKCNLEISDADGIDKGYTQRLAINLENE